MKSLLHISVRCVIVMALLISLPAASRAQRGEAPATPEDIGTKNVTIMSEGTRMAGDIFWPKSAGETTRLPTIVMSHGWGGMASQLRADAIVFARAGYFVLAFDYRGWGASDSRVILTGPQPGHPAGGKFTAEVQEVREVVDPVDMAADLNNAICWVWGEPQCDQDRIGLWGTSYSGGHVVYAAARNPRVKCLVSQVGGCDSRPFVMREDAERLRTYTEASERAHGDRGYPKPRTVELLNLTGGPVREKLMQFAPTEEAARASQCAMLIIVAEKEELFDNKEQGILVYERTKGPKKLVTIPDITHYGIYSTAKPQAQKLAVEWFDEHLKKASK